MCQLLSRKENGQAAVDFFIVFVYTKNDCTRRGKTMNVFEKEVQSKRNDAVDSAVGFIVSFGFFATMFIIATLIEFFGR
ncbi:Conserved hypothetical protein [Geobacillus thermodenitrificans NG80-2]|uniref:YqzM family protein n=2 Tax=Geobacillus thermodenitrificans TaxID=33940 RepID=A4IR41_GEOTN|nr:Conserved hypothetical protein [Geobacillus thermodenitrificans NG80-2]